MQQEPVVLSGTSGDKAHRYRHPDWAYKTQGSLGPLVFLPQLVVRELYVLYTYVYFDLSTSVLPTTIFALVSYHARVRGQELTAELLLEAVKVVAFSVLYLIGYIGSFNISNQLAGKAPTEDEINKRMRPLPSKLVTLEGAWIRMWIVMLMYAGLGLVGGWQLFFCCLVWLFVIFIHNHAKLRHIAWVLGLFVPKRFIKYTEVDEAEVGLVGRWGVKSWAMTTGTLSMLSAGWLIGGSALTWPPFLWLATIAFLLFPTCPVQDVRDQEGDKFLKRKTLPLLIGDRNARIVLAVVFFINPFVTLLVSWFGPWEVVVPIGILLAFNSFIFGISWLIAFRLLIYRNKKADHRTYMLYTYWFMFCLAFSLFIL